MKIWCLFSVANNYDQPDNNLVAWWPEKPSIETVAKCCGQPFPSNIDLTTLSIVKIWSGETASLNPGDTDYRIEEVEDGKILV